MSKRYDRAYFDRWYRDPRHRVGSQAALVRKVAMVLHAAEYYLGRPLANVLDVGCGEAPWRGQLLKFRPALDYRGLDSSDYVIERYGRARNIGRARFGDLAELRFEHPFDLIICSDMLHYVPAPELRRGLSGFAELLEGMAFLEAFTSSDAIDGDLDGYIARPATWYRRCFEEVGLRPLGGQLWIAPKLAGSLTALEWP